MTFNFFFYIIAIIAIVADFFFNTDATGIIALGALPMTTDLSRFFPATATSPDFTAFPFEHDFVLDGKPQSFKRNADGSLIPAVGEVVETAYGIGYLERRHVSGSYIVRITDFNDREFPRYGNTILKPATHSVTSRQAVAELNDRYNTHLLGRSEWFLARMNDKAYAQELLDMLVDTDCYEVSFTGGDYGGATEFMFDRAINPIARVKSSAETKAYRARMKALADKMLKDAEALEDVEDAMPSDIADELAEVFGE